MGVWAQEQGLTLINYLDLHGPIPSAECLRNFGHVAALMVHPSPWGNCPGAVARVPVSVWELAHSAPQVGIMAPQLPCVRAVVALGQQPLSGFPHVCSRNLAGTGDLFPIF